MSLKSEYRYLNNVRLGSLSKPKYTPAQKRYIKIMQRFGRFQDINADARILDFNEVKAYTAAMIEDQAVFFHHLGKSISFLPQAEIDKWKDVDIIP